jgi:hypothetical protein
MSMQMGAARIGGWPDESEPDHEAARSARPDRDTDAGTELRRAGRACAHGSNGVLTGSALFTGRWVA